MKSGYTIQFKTISAVVRAPGIPEEHQGFPVPREFPSDVPSRLAKDLVERLEDRIPSIEFRDMGFPEDTLHFSSESFYGWIKKYFPGTFDADCNETVMVNIDYRRGAVSDPEYLPEYESIADLVAEWEKAGESVVRKYE